MFSYIQKTNVLGLCYAELELDHHYIRAVTPFYAVYDIAFSKSRPDACSTLTNDGSAAAKAIRASCSRKPSGWQVRYIFL